MKRKKRKNKERESLRLTDKKHPMIAVVSTMIGIFSMLIFMVTCVIASYSKGNAGIYIGLIGICCMVLCVVGFICAWISLHMEDIRPLFPTLGSLINGLLILFFLVLYVWGALV